MSCWKAFSTVCRAEDVVSFHVIYNKISAKRSKNKSRLLLFHVSSEPHLSEKHIRRIRHAVYIGNLIACDPAIFCFATDFVSCFGQFFKPAAYCGIVHPFDAVATRGMFPTIDNSHIIQDTQKQKSEQKRGNGDTDTSFIVDNFYFAFI